MKSGLVKRILAMVMMVLMLSGDTLPVMAETVSGGDSVINEQGVISDEQIDNTDAYTDPDETEKVPNTETTEVTDSENVVEEKNVADEVFTDDSATVSGGDAVVDTDTVSGGDLVEIEDEEVPLAPMPVTEFAETINGVTIKMSAPEDAFEEGTTMVVTEIAPQEVEVAIENVEKETQTVVRRYRAFDIKLVNEAGEEVQPLNDRTVTVTFEGDMLLPEEGESVDVFHVEDTEATSMGAKVVEETVVTEEVVAVEETTEVEETVEIVTETTEVVEMETTHFSVYVVAITAGAEDYTITYRQYNGECGSEDAIEIYRKSETVYSNISKKEFTLEELVETGRLAAGANYQLNSIVVAEEGKDAVIYNDISVNEGYDVVTINVSGDTTISFYYSPVNKGLIANDVTMFDYDVVGSYEEIEGIDFPTVKEYWNEYLKKTVKYIDGSYDCVDSIKTGHGTFGKTLIAKESGMIVLYTDVSIERKHNENRITNHGQIVWLGNGDQVWNMSINGEFYPHVKIVIENGAMSFNGSIGSINNNAYNSDGSLKSEKYLAMGLVAVHGINGYVNKNVNGENVSLNINANNAWNEKWQPDENGNWYGTVTQHGDYAILPGLVQDFASDDTSYENLVMANGIYEPGYFTDEEFEGKRIFDNRFKLNFAQIGDTYTLVNAADTVAGSTTNTFKYAYDENKTNYALKDNYQDISASFFPLENVNGEVNDQTNESGAHNCYFGMRYDFSFKIGDYVGPINYTFAGDDDMWVFLDGKLVMDLGGMHSAYPTAPHYNDNTHAWNNQMTDSTDEYSVNLWKTLLNMPNVSDEELQARIDTLTDAEKEADHQVTVLYMERGGYDSSCFMQFVIPNVVPMESVIQKPADLELTKVDSETGEALSGAIFKLTKYTNNKYETIDTNFGKEGAIEVVSDSNGKLKFKGLEEGHYKMVETKAPSGYYLTTDEYNVVATATDDNTISVTVKGISDGKIENIPMDLVLDSDKKATLVDWEKRVYKIDLKAIAQIESISTAKNANVLLLVDASGSMIFTDAQISAEQLDESKIYFTNAFVSPNSYNAYGNGYNVSSSVGNRLLSTAKSGKTYYGIPSNGSYVFYADNGWYKKDISKLDDSNALNIKGATKVDPTKITLYTNRSEIFVNAAEAFVNGLSENSKVAVVTFGNEGSASKKIDFTSLKTGKTNVIDAVNAATGVYYTGTHAAPGFNQAANMYKALNDYDNSYLVFFTDGELNDANSAKNAATTIKDKGVEVFAIGVGEGNSDSLYQIASSDEHVKTCTNMADVANALTSLGITAPGTLENVKIVDEISSYFELCDQDGNPISSLEGATISYKDGKQVITWNNQIVPIGAEGLSKTIYVKAKDNFAGGNYVPTNGDFTVSAPDEEPSGQDTPHVNVRTNIKAGVAENTIFLGENLESYFTNEQQTAVSGARFDEYGNIVAVLNEEGKEFTNLDYVDVTVVWKDAEGNAVTVDDIRLATPTEETQYYATITVSPKYAAGSAQAQEASKSMQMASDDTLYAVETIQADPDGKYTVKVVTGQIAVTKKIKESDINYNDGDPIFTFQIEKDGLTQTRMVRFSKKVVRTLDVVDGYVSLTVKFDNLEKGIYNVTELDTLGYTLESKMVDSTATNCGYDDSIAFAIGQTSMDNAATDLDATKGAAVYANAVTNDRNESDKDMVVNQVVIEDGKVVIKKQVVPEQE